MLRVRARVRITPTPNSNFHRVRVLLHERRVSDGRVDVVVAPLHLVGPVEDLMKHLVGCLVALHVVVVGRVEERRRPGRFSGDKGEI